MAPESDAAKLPAKEAPQDDWRKKETLGGFLRDVAIAAVILGLGLAVYVSRERTNTHVREIGKQAKEHLVKDSPKGYVEAEKKLLEMVSLRSSHPFAVSTLAELYAVRWIDFGMQEDAAKAREWAAKADKTDAPINERYGAVLLVMLGDKKFAEAEKYAADINNQIRASHVINGWGRALRNTGRLAEARMAFKKAADIEWRNPRYACDFADNYFEDGDYLNALSFYNKGVEANSEHPRSLIGRSRAQIARGQRIKDATETLAALTAPESLAALPPRLKAQALVATAELKLFEQNAAEAQQLAEQAIAADATYAWGPYVRGRALAAQKNLEAAAAFDKAIELDRFVPEYYYGGAAAMLVAGDSAKATGLLDAFAKALKEDDRLHLTYGQVLNNLGKADEALAHFDKAIELNNFNALAHYEKGATLFTAKKDFDNAKKEIELALEVQEYLPEAYVKLGDLLFEKKEYGEACQQYAQALIQLKQLQAPREKMTDLREMVNTRLVKEAKQREIAKAWMTETGAMIR